MYTTTSKCVLFIFSVLVSFVVSAQLKSPETFLGYELGERFTRHHQVVDYFKYLAEESPNVYLTQYGETYEKRPLYLAFISSAENLDRLETIRTDNLKRAGLIKGDPQNRVSVVWLSYNVHGNESVSTEASLSTLYELVRADSDKADWLKNTVVVLDPCVNPDGRARYVNFYWEHGNRPYNPDLNSWEHHETWPSGRANHYLFDLNRDWAWQTQVESQQRMEVYNQWLPHVHVDFHEQGINSPYYFAPAAKPFHELISEWQRDFQTQIGKNHAKYFDGNNWLYFTKQVFDLLYPSYGDTYPTYNGAIGMTYEQAGSGRAGLGVIKQEGDTLTLKDRMERHYTTGLSTIEITSKNNHRVLEEFQKFFNQPAPVKYKSYVLKFDGNTDKFNRLKKWLDIQGIQYNSVQMARGIQVQSNKGLRGYSYKTKGNQPFEIGDKDLVISADQPKSVLTSVLFEPNTRLVDSLTYDITSWAIPYVCGIEAYAVTSPVAVKTEMEKTAFQAPALEEAYGYIFKWNSIEDARFLAALLKRDLNVRYTSRPINIQGKVFDRGSFIVTAGDNSHPDFVSQFGLMVNEYNRTATPIYSGFVTGGPDIGSNDVRFIRAPKVALIGGEGTSSLDYGATWHFFEQVIEYPVTTLSSNYFSSVDLRQYDVIIMQNGQYENFDESVITKLNGWVMSGGTLIAVQGALNKFISEGGELSPYNSNEEKAVFEAVDASIKEELRLVSKKDENRYQIREYVAGAVFAVRLDPTHPLAYGYDKTYYSLKTSNQRYGYLSQNNVGVITSKDAHLSGFAGQFVLEKIPKSLVFGVEEKGAGNIVYMVDNPLFRSFWENGKLLFANAVFYVSN